MTRETCRHVAATHPHLIAPPFDDFYSAHGFDALYGVFESFSGMSIYVPGARVALLGCILAEARKEFNGANYAALARKYGYSERAFRRLL